MFQFRPIRNVLVGMQVLGDDVLDLFDLSRTQVLGHLVNPRLIFRFGRFIGWRGRSGGRRRLFRLTLDLRLLLQFLLGPGLHQVDAFLFGHDPALLHADAEASLHATVLAAFAGR